MHKVILILDKFFLKYEKGGQIDLPSQEKLPSKIPALLGLKATYFTGYADGDTPFVARDNTADVIKA